MGLASDVSRDCKVTNKSNIVGNAFNNKSGNYLAKKQPKLFNVEIVYSLVLTVQQKQEEIVANVAPTCSTKPKP